MLRSLFLAAVLALAGAAHAQDWQLVWADEFDAAGAPDPSRWAYDIGGGGWGNEERQFYTDRPENVRVEDGALVIEAREESFGGSPYTSARLVTRGRASWQYGRFEARIQMPEGQGIWPAFWMLATDSPYGEWPASGEIDIMEMLGNDTQRVYGTIHYGGRELGRQFTGQEFDLAAGSFSDAYHTFAVEWEPTEIRWYVDGELYQTRTAWSSGAAVYPAPFDQPFHLLLNVAVGGIWPGYPDASTQFPQRMLVDYVRVYRDASAYPEVSFTAPETANAGGAVAVSATASHPDGIDRVEFLHHGGVLATDSEAPYEWAVSGPGVSAGCYTLSARAVTTRGYTSESEPVEVTVGDGCPPGSSSPFLIAPQRVPGVVEAEFFDLGGPGVAYRDLGVGNSVGSIRLDEDVDIGPARDAGAGYEIEAIFGREWVGYTVDVQEAGTYRITARTSSVQGGRMRLAVDGEDLFGDVDVDVTNSSIRYANTLLGDAELSSGRHTVRVDMRSGGFTLNSLRFTRVNTTAAEGPASSGALDLQVGPNPARSRALLTYRVGTPGTVRVVVVDATGREVHRATEEAPAPGSRTHALDLGELAPGTYVALVSTPDGTQSRRFAVVR